MTAAPPVRLRQTLREIVAGRAGRVLRCRVRLAGSEPVTARYRRVRIAGAGLRDYTDARPADAFKLHLPAVPGAPVPLPEYDDRGRPVRPDDPAHRPLVRCFTVAAADPATGELAFDAYLHDDGATARWLATARPGDELALTGMRTEYAVAPGSRSQLLVADPSALPAAADVVAAVPPDQPVHLVAHAHPGDRRLVRPGPNTTVTWVGDAARLAGAVAALPAPGDGAQAWVCAEAAAVRAVRAVLLDRHGLHRDALHAAAYWKRGQDWEALFDESMERFLRAADAGLDTGDPGLLQRLAFDPPDLPNVNR